jgi:pimeloyl-ACP methyl ester carboxylesterase
MMRLRTRFLTDRILAGGLASFQALPEPLAKELNDVGVRSGHYRGFLSLLAHERLWNEARREYAHIKVPVLLIYGDKDWAPPAERERTRSLLPSAQTGVVADGGHFLSLDRPHDLEQLIVRFALP